MTGMTDWLLACQVLLLTGILCQSSEPPSVTLCHSASCDVFLQQGCHNLPRPAHLHSVFTTARVKLFPLKECRGSGLQIPHSFKKICVPPYGYFISSYRLWPLPPPEETIADQPFISNSI